MLFSYHPLPSPGPTESSPTLSPARPQNSGLGTQCGSLQTQPPKTAPTWPPDKLTTMQAAGPAWLGSSVRYHGPKKASPPDQPIPTRAKEPTVTLSSSGASSPSPPCADGHAEAREQAEREARSLHPPPKLTGTRGHLPRTPAASPFTPFSGWDCSPLLAFSSLQEAPGKEVWELSLFGETPLFPAPLCQGALAKNWARKGPSASSLRWGKLPPHSSHLHMEGHPVVTGRPAVTSTFTGGFGTRPEVLSSQREGPPTLFPDQLFLRSCAFNCCRSPPTCKGLPFAGRGSSWTAESERTGLPAEAEGGAVHVATQLKSPSPVSPVSLQQ